MSPGRLTFHRTAPDEADAARLIEELSATLAAITGDSGQRSFANDDVADARAAFLVARQGKHAVACGALRPIDDTTCELKRMYVRGRRAGIGGRLLAELEQEAARLNYGRIVLETRKVNVGAVAFYLKHGYRVIPNYGKYVGNDLAICFAKELSQSPDPGSTL